MPKRILEGVVISDKSEKTITVMVERKIKHPLYKKFITRSKKYAVHDKNNDFKTGDTVSIQECRPVSKHKHWEVLSASSLRNIRD